MPSPLPKDSRNRPGRQRERQVYRMIKVPGERDYMITRVPGRKLARKKRAREGKMPKTPEQNSQRWEEFRARKEQRQKKNQKIIDEWTGYEKEERPVREREGVGDPDISFLYTPEGMFLFLALYFFLAIVVALSGFTASVDSEDSQEGVADSLCTFFCFSFILFFSILAISGRKKED